MQLIKDGKGRGYVAEVNAENQLAVQAVNIDYGQYISLIKKDVYTTQMAFKQTTGGVGEFAGILTYTGEKAVVLRRLVINTNETGECKLEIFMGTIMTSGGLAVDTTNLNTLSTKILSASLLHQNIGVNPFTPYYEGINIYTAFIIGGGAYNLETDGAFILRPNLPMALKITSDTTNAYAYCFTTVYEIDI